MLVLAEEAASARGAAGAIPGRAATGVPLGSWKETPQTLAHQFPHCPVQLQEFDLGGTLLAADAHAEGYRAGQYQLTLRRGGDGLGFEFQISSQ